MLLLQSYHAGANSANRRWGEGGKTTRQHHCRRAAPCPRLSRRTLNVGQLVSAVKSDAGPDEGAPQSPVPLLALRGDDPDERLAEGSWLRLAGQREYPRTRRPVRPAPLRLPLDQLGAVVPRRAVFATDVYPSTRARNFVHPATKGRRLRPVPFVDHAARADEPAAVAVMARPHFVPRSVGFPRSANPHRSSSYFPQWLMVANRSRRRPAQPFARTTTTPVGKTHTLSAVRCLASTPPNKIIVQRYRPMTMLTNHASGHNYSAASC